MAHYKYVVLGAGPTGLTVARALLDRGETSVLVLEKEPEPGGLCRSATVDGAPLDIGGGHFLDVVRPEANEFLYRFMPLPEWDEFQRNSKIRIYGRDIGYPLESYLWELDPDEAVEILESVARAGCVQGTPMPESFEEWITWKLGERIARDYMLPYNRKIWSVDLNRLGTYWLYKLPNVSFRDVLRSCLTRNRHGTVPAHGVFLYPKRYGYGEVWKRIGDSLKEHLALGCEVRDIDVAEKRINGEIHYGVLINTIPWPAWLNARPLPVDVKRAIEGLAHASIDVNYYPEDPPPEVHWIYVPDESISYHRILCRANFARGSRGYWTETNSKRTPPDLSHGFHNEFAYPLNTLDKRERMKTICEWAAENGIMPLGRWGLWEHMNSDTAVSLALRAAAGFFQ